MSILGKIGYGGITTVIGLIIVFTGLIIIIACLYAMAAIFKKINRNRARKAEALKAAEPQPAQPEAPAQAEEPKQEDESELIAVIAAAIAAFDFGSRPVRIKSIRRVNGWKNAARTEQVYKF